MRKRARNKTNWSVPAFAAAVLVVLGAAYAFHSYGQPQDMPYYDENPGNLSLGEPIHWHPHLRIVLEGEEVAIPGGVGIIIGNVVDTDISRMRMSPMHTHADDGIIHMEQTVPTNRTLRLGYFFDVWGEEFNSTCVLGRCNSGGSVVKMFVNGKRSSEFDDYVPYDKDEIVIRYESETFGS